MAVAIEDSADAGTVQFPHLADAPSGGDGPTQFLTVLPGVCQAGAHAFPQNLSFELSNSANTARSAAIARPAGVVRSP